MKEASEKAQPLGERYGKDIVQAAANEISRYDSDKQMLFLNDEARKLCFQLLGFPPEHPLYAKKEEPPAHSDTQPSSHATAQKKRRQHKDRSRS